MRAVKFIFILTMLVTLASLVSIFIPPHKLSLAGILCLFIPVLAGFNALGLLYFRIKKSRWWIPACIIAILSAIVISNTLSFINRETEFESSVYLMTYNSNKQNPLTKNIFNDTERQKLSSWVIENKFDVVCYQEMIENLQHPYTMLGYQKLFSGKITEEGDRLGLFIFSKLPIVKNGKIEFGDNSFNRLLWADVVSGQDTLRVINIHMKSYNFEPQSVMFNLSQLKKGVAGRSYHTKKTYDFIRKSPYPVILCGDFNETPYSYSYRKFQSILNDSFLRSGAGYAHTYKVKKTIPFRIDYVFTDPELKTKDYTVFYNLPWSDHSPLAVRIGK
jgi:endonuclease/exonuclease/phosphatase family metal-dependent hydrolase